MGIKFICRRRWQPLSHSSIPTAISNPFLGFFNGMELTVFVMAQGIIGAFLVRVPVSFIMSKVEPASLFFIGLATPCSTVLQILLCVGCMVYIKKRKSIQI